MPITMWREYYIITCFSLPVLSTGISFGFPSVLTPALLKNTSEIQATKDQTSWIAATFALTGPIGFIILPNLMQYSGRRLTSAIGNFSMALGSVVIALSTDITTLVIGRGLQGISFCSLILSSIMIGEYCSPKLRGIGVICKTTCVFTGVLICHTLGLWYSWRLIAWVSVIPAIMGIITIFTLPESPAWLAYQERFDDSKIAFKWIRGNIEECKDEINELITAQRCLSLRAKNGTMGSRMKILCDREFLWPLLNSVLITIVMQCCGLMYLIAYLIEIMEDVTGHSNISYYVISFDLMKVIAMSVTACMIKRFGRRSILLVSSVVASLLLLLVCILDYLTTIDVLNVNWLTPLVLIVYNFVCCIGVTPLVVLMKGEMFSLRLKGISLTVLGIISTLTSAVTLKVTSTMLDVLKVYGTFAVYLVFIVTCTVILYFTLPETKDRTLQDIELETMGDKLKSDNRQSDDNCEAKMMYVNERGNRLS